MLDGSGGSGHNVAREGERQEDLALSIQIQFAKKVNVDLQFSWKSIQQMSPEHNQVGPVVIPYSGPQLGFGHCYNQFKGIFCGHVGICN